MRGRKPLPSKILDIKGGSKHTHRPPRSGEPNPPLNIPKCPPHLDKEAKAEWRRMAKELEPLGLLTNLDKAVFALYCQSYSTWVQAANVIKDKGMIFVAPGKTRTLRDGTIEKVGAGLPIVNPYFQIANKAKEEMMKTLVEMGMTPSSRSRVKVPEQKPVAENRRERFFK
jgi:P27 family predicted phage terminase small subunit